MSEFNLVMACLCSIFLIFVFGTTIEMENHESLDHPVSVEYWDGHGNFSIEYSEDDIINYPIGIYRTVASFNSHRFVTLDDPAVNKLYAALAERMIGMSEWEKANYLCGFVYYNVSYIFDIENNGCQDYLQYASETLLSLKGDCDDHAILLYNLYRLSGIDTKVASTVNHWFLIINIGGEDINVDPTNYSYIGPAIIEGPYILSFYPIFSGIILLIFFAIMFSGQLIFIRDYKN